MTVFIVLAVMLAALFIDSRFRLVSTEYTLSYAGLPESFDGFRIVQLSDFHMADFGGRLIAGVKKQDPDIIALTGDFLNKDPFSSASGQTERLRPFLEALREIAPCYFVSGNHDWASGEIGSLQQMLGEIRVRYLHNECVIIERGEARIILAGVEDPNGPADMIKPDALAEIINDNFPDSFTVMLAHRNDFPVKYPGLDIDLLLCGHGHGGLIRLPLLGGLFGTEHNLFPKYDAGLYDAGSYDMLVSRGLGGVLPRFLNNPELVTVILRKS
ncbi:MAG: metallophosphoesterase [Oscillospiraceae bacterium]|jgi:predicted MPP superfamily phosphohydrolase|nr:metallophosphoesterase [Oscillospiraceae bacterium]